LHEKLKTREAENLLGIEDKLGTLKSARARITLKEAR
jgi:hypothetical protein